MSPPVSVQPPPRKPAPASDRDVMYEQFDFLMQYLGHPSDCSCDFCPRVRELERVLLEPFHK